MRDKVVAPDEVVVAISYGGTNCTLALSGPGSEQRLEASLKGLLNCTRGYLETSRHYGQKLLDELCVTERLIEEMLKHKYVQTREYFPTGKNPSRSSASGRGCKNVLDQL